MLETAVAQEFEKHYVKTGLSDGVYIEVKDGLDLEDKLKGEKERSGKKKNNN